jgi:hypothetical protein
LKNKYHNVNTASKQCKYILYTLVTTLVFEGILRKLLPVLNLPIFFLKDILCIISVYIVIKLKMPTIIATVSNYWIRLCFLFIPLLCFTGFKDPLLIIFAAKQYLLYIVVVVIVSVAFRKGKEEEFKKFVFFNAVLLLPTTIIAVIQNSLPATHWLNTSVGGESMEAFSAGGYLRVGSTFSFTAQYSWFLTVETAFLLTSFFLPPQFKFKYWKFVNTLTYLVLFLMLIVGAFITGGRTAVLGCGTTLVLGFIFIGIKNSRWILSKGALIIFLSVISLFVLRAVKPQFFLAYDARSSGTENATHSEEVVIRVFNGLTDWTSWFWEQDLANVIAGNGLSIMSNGSSQVSSYAASVRSDGFWTEGDVPTTFWEGGVYLALIWYGFRFSLIILCLRLWYKTSDRIIASAAAVPLAYVIIQGSIAQIGMQPPLFVWWSFSIGTIILLYRIDLSRNKMINL